MAEVFALFGERIVSSGGVTYTAQACGAPAAYGLWEGWVEFIPLGRAARVRSPRETTQPNRIDTLYWATGLTSVYLEGALQRALTSALPKKTKQVSASALKGAHNPVFDPFSMRRKREELLRQELSALSTWHLINIILAYRFSSEPVDVLSRFRAARLIEVIVTGVRQGDRESFPLCTR